MNSNWPEFHYSVLSHYDHYFLNDHKILNLGNNIDYQHRDEYCLMSDSDVVFVSLRIDGIISTNRAGLYNFKNSIDELFREMSYKCPSIQQLCFTECTIAFSSLRIKCQFDQGLGDRMVRCAPVQRAQYVY